MKMDSSYSTGPTKSGLNVISIIDRESCANLFVYSREFPSVSFTLMEGRTGATLQKMGEKSKENGLHLSPSEEETLPFPILFVDKFEFHLHLTAHRCAWLWRSLQNFHNKIVHRHGIGVKRDALINDIDGVLTNCSWNIVERKRDILHGCQWKRFDRDFLIRISILHKKISKWYSTGWRKKCAFETILFFSFGEWRWPSFSSFSFFPSLSVFFSRLVDLRPSR